MKLHKIIYFSAAVLGLLAAGSAPQVTHANQKLQAVRPTESDAQYEFSHTQPGAYGAGNPMDNRTYVKPVAIPSKSAKKIANHKVIGHVYKHGKGYLKYANISAKYIYKHGNPYHQPSTISHLYNDFLTGTAAIYNKPSIKRHAHKVITNRQARTLAMNGVPFKTLRQKNLINRKHQKKTDEAITPYYLVRTKNPKLRGWVIDTGIYEDDEVPNSVSGKRSHKRNVKKHITKRHTRKHSVKRNRKCTKRNKRNK